MASASSSIQPTIRKINSVLYELYKPATSSVNIEIIFFHGLQAQDDSEAYLKTWMVADDSECWLNTWLAEDFPQARILSVTYDSRTEVSNTTERKDMYTICEDLVHNLIGSKIIGQYCPVVMVGYGIGGLVLKQVCLQADRLARYRGSGANPYQTFLGNMKRAFFYSTPNSGLRFCLTPTPEHRAPLLQYLEPFSKEAARLTVSFAALRQLHRWKTYGLILQGAGSIIRTPHQTSRSLNRQPQHSLLVEEDEVEEGSAYSLLVEEGEVEQGSARFDVDHFNVVTRQSGSICKPIGRWSINYTLLVKVVREVLEIEDTRAADEQDTIAEKTMTDA